MQWNDVPYSERVKLMEPTIFHKIYRIIGFIVLMSSKVVEVLTIDKLRLWLGSNSP